MLACVGRDGKKSSSSSSSARKSKKSKKRQEADKDTIQLLSVTNGTALNVQDESQPPMPGRREVEHYFSELLRELQLPDHSKKELIALPIDKKWQIYCQKTGRTHQEIYPEVYIEKLKELRLVIEFKAWKQGFSIISAEIKLKIC